MIVLNVLLWVLAAILALLLLILLLMLPSVRIRVSMRGGEIKASAHYLIFFYRLHPRPEKPEKKPKKPKPAPEPEEPEPPPEKADKPSLPEMWKQYKPLLRSAKAAMRYLCKRVVIYKVRARVKVAGPDAHAAALRYASAASLVAALTQVLGWAFTLRRADIQLVPDFIHEQSEYDIAFRVRIRPIYALIMGVRLLIVYLTTARRRKKTRKGGKQYERAASH